MLRALIIQCVLYADAYLLSACVIDVFILLKSHFLIYGLQPKLNEYSFRYLCDIILVNNLMFYIYMETVHKVIDKCTY